MWESWMKEPLSARLLEFLSTISDSGDEFLVEFILVLLEHQKSRQEIASDLEDFLDENAEPVSHWLWNTMLELQEEHQQRNVPPPQSVIETSPDSEISMDSMSDTSVQGKRRRHIESAVLPMDDLKTRASRLRMMVSAAEHSSRDAEQAQKRSRREPSPGLTENNYGVLHRDERIACDAHTSTTHRHQPLPHSQHSQFDAHPHPHHPHHPHHPQHHYDQQHSSPDLYGASVADQGNVFDADEILAQRRVAIELGDEDLPTDVHCILDLLQDPETSFSVSVLVDGFPVVVPRTFFSDEQLNAAMWLQFHQRQQQRGAAGAAGAGASFPRGRGGRGYFASRGRGSFASRGGAGYAARGGHGFTSFRSRGGPVSVHGGRGGRGRALSLRWTADSSSDSSSASESSDRTIGKEELTGSSAPTEGQFRFEVGARVWTRDGLPSKPRHFKRPKAFGAALPSKAKLVWSAEQPESIGTEDDESSSSSSPSLSSSSGSSAFSTVTSLPPKQQLVWSATSAADEANPSGTAASAPPSLPSTESLVWTNPEAAPVAPRSQLQAASPARQPAKQALVWTNPEVAQVSHAPAAVPAVNSHARKAAPSALVWTSDQALESDLASQSAGVQNHQDRQDDQAPDDEPASGDEDQGEDTNQADETDDPAAAESLDSGWEARQRGRGRGRGRGWYGQARGARGRGRGGRGRGRGWSRGGFAPGGRAMRGGSTWRAPSDAHQWVAPQE
eukprot:CAMPEP_0177644108 /NCGR_PEP_ID=MMETSP0447-20121125/8505_1 /TAXON_ID=0 /ORGANISM="Stygamoeba regulata, Strain BSH-02190019" /LENGTH=729 /DNA_ID=CAMNT_0019146433 /DNA_START=102 /DNA_END=2291 /DNA_ORIENTATION=+